MGVFAPFPRDGEEQMTGREHVLVPPTRAPASFPLRAAVAPDPNVSSFQLANGRGEGFLGDTLSKSSSITCHSRSSRYSSPREALLKIKSSSSPGAGGEKGGQPARSRCRSRQQGDGWLISGVTLRDNRLPCHSLSRKQLLTPK